MFTFFKRGLHEKKPQRVRHTDGAPAAKKKKKKNMQRNPNFKYRVGSVVMTWAGLAATGTNPVVFIDDFICVSSTSSKCIKSHQWAELKSFSEAEKAQLMESIT